MAAAERRKSPPPVLLPLLPLLLLLSGRPALGNVGAAAGNCWCEKHRTEPPLVKKFPDRAVDWKRCGHFVRFNFPQKRVCGLDDAPWVLRLLARMGEKQKKGSARVSSTERNGQPRPASCASLPPLSSVGSTLVVPTETLPSHQGPDSTRTTATPALESLWNADAVAEVGPNRFGQEEGVPGWHRAAVLSALGIVLLLGMVGLLCWWRRPRRGFRAALVSEQQGQEPYKEQSSPLCGRWCEEDFH